MASTPVWAQRTEDPYRPIRSLGLPPRFTAYGGFSAVGTFGSELTPGGAVFAGLRHEVLRPAMGLFGLAAEGFAGITDAKVQGGIRLYGTLRALMFRAGVEFSSGEGSTPLFTAAVEHPVVRGGVLAPGGLMRIDWTPGAHRVGVGVSLPLFQPMAGRTRPADTEVRPLQVAPLPRPPPLADSMAALLHAIETSALWIDEMTTPFLSSSEATDREFRAEVEAKVAYIAQSDALAPEGHAYPIEVARYHRLLGRLFRDGSVTARARRIVLEEVVLPMNALFGRVRGADVFAAFARNAVHRFSAELPSQVAPTGTSRDEIAGFRAWLAVLAMAEHRERRRWRDSRLIWLPFQLVLTPDEHDSQAEVDALVERLLGQPLQERNDFTYLINEAFSPELISSIHEARRYHVLWVHDFAGTAPDGRVDRVAARVVVEGYLSALTSAVRRFDERGTIPAFMIFLDQWYFDLRHTRWWMRALADPLGTAVRLPREAAEVEAWVDDAQRQLRVAVSNSSRLQALARVRGAAWLREYVKVHVSVTYPGDASFRRRIPARSSPLMFADDYMRDHRKVAFWDLSEANPRLGGALFTGEGVGENYEGANWEDRTLLVHGVAALPLKEAARRLFLDHGYRESDLPAPLLPDALDPADSGSPSALAMEWSSRLLQAANATGYGPKQASVLKAALYNLMPAGSRILAPDSQWSSFFWAGMLVGSALRGCHVFVIAPRLENAPYAAAMVQSVLAHDVLEGYLQLRVALAPAFAASGGGLYVGLYGQDISTRSLRERYLGVIEGLRSPTFPRTAFPFPDALYRRLADTAVLARLLSPAGDSSLHQATLAAAPRLHLKSQLFVSEEGLERVLRDPGWFEVFSRYVAERAREFAADHRQAAGGRISPSLLGPVDSTLTRAPPSERAHDLFYLLTGSQNQNDRSLYLDGEIMCLIAGPHALASLIDFVAIAARSVWVQDGSALDSLIPRLSRDKVRLARSLRTLF